MAKKDILLTVNTSWNLSKFRLGLIQSLRADGHRVSGLAPHDDAVSTLVSSGVDMHHVDMDATGLSPLHDLRLARRFYRIFKELRPDIIFGFTIKNNVYGAFAARVLGIPFVPNVTGLGSAFLGNPWITRLAKGLYRRSFRHCPIVFFQNSDDMHLFIDQGLTSKGQARLLPGSGINLDEFAPADLPNSGDVCFLQIGRLLGDKGVREFADAARIVKKTHPTARFQILGGHAFGNRTSVSDTDVAAWQSAGYVEYLGEANDVRPYIAAADCICLASYREGLPRTLLEAAAMARPLIATDVPGCRSVVEDGKNGYLCGARNSESLAAAMIRMIDAGGAAREQMGANSRQLVADKFDEQLVFAAYKQVIAALG